MHKSINRKICISMTRKSVYSIINNVMTTQAEKKYNTVKKTNLLQHKHIVAKYTFHTEVYTARVLHNKDKTF